MTITEAVARFGLVGRVTPAGTRITGPLLVGEREASISWNDADIVHSFKVTAAAAANVATLTISSGAVAQTTGTPTITDGDGNDAEGIALPTMVTLYGILVKMTTAGTSVTVAGTQGLAGVLESVGDRLQIGFASGRTTLGTVTLTFAGGAEAVEVVVLGKSS